MKKNIFIATLLFAINIFGQNNKPVVLFDFDSTKIYSNYSDLEPYIKEYNNEFGNIYQTIAVNDTIKISGTIVKSSTNNNIYLLGRELFSVVKTNKCKIYFHDKLVTKYYTKEIKKKKNRKLDYIGLQYFDKSSKKLFIVECIYKKYLQSPGTPAF